MSIQEPDQPNVGEEIGNILGGVADSMPTEKSKKIVGISALVASIGGAIARLFKRK